jgi:hypothetical protein
MAKKAFDRLTQGTYRVINPSKFRGSLNGGGALTCIYRSSWERRLMAWLDTNPAILAWGSERVIVQYNDESDLGKLRRYFIDFDFELRDQEGKLKKFWCEVKPHEYTIPPKQPKRLTESTKRNYLMNSLTYVRNVCKWNAAKKSAINHGATFFILTEQNASFFTK